MVIYHRHTYPHHFMPFGPGTWYHIPLNIVALRGHQAFGARVADTGLGAHTMNRRELSTSRNINRVSSYQIILHQNPAFLPFIFWVVHGVSPFHQLILVLWGLIVGHVPGESIVPTSPVQGPPSNRWSVEILWPPLPCLEERGCLSRGSSYTQGLLFTCWIWSRYIEYLQFQFKTDFFFYGDCPISKLYLLHDDYICTTCVAKFGRDQSLNHSTDAAAYFATVATNKPPSFGWAAVIVSKIPVQLISFGQTRQIPESRGPGCPEWLVAMAVVPWQLSHWLSCWC